MGIPLKQAIEVGKYVMARLGGNATYDYVEPFRCNLECVGCGKTVSEDILKRP